MSNKGTFPPSPLPCIADEKRKRVLLSHRTFKLRLVEIMPEAESRF
jgi:hypothetical protein